MPQWMYSGKYCVGNEAETFTFVTSPIHLGSYEFLDKVAPVEPSQVTDYLKSFGYAAHGPDSWLSCPKPGNAEMGKKIAGTALSLGTINGHIELEGHTWYNMLCHLRISGVAAKHWNVQRRLHHLRKLLHDPVKKTLGKEYEEYFAESRFASHGGIAGTTDSIMCWLETLATQINAGRAPPSLVALTLRFLEAPSFTESDMNPDIPRSILRKPSITPPLAEVITDSNEEMPRYADASLEEMSKEGSEDHDIDNNDGAVGLGIKDSSGVASRFMEDVGDDEDPLWIPEEEEHRVLT